MSFDKIAELSRRAGYDTERSGAALRLFAKGDTQQLGERSLEALSNFLYENYVSKFLVHAATWTPLDGETVFEAMHAERLTHDTIIDHMPSAAVTMPAEHKIEGIYYLLHGTRDYSRRYVVGAIKIERVESALLVKQTAFSTPRDQFDEETGLAVFFEQRLSIVFLDKRALSPGVRVISILRSAWNRVEHIGQMFGLDDSSQPYSLAVMLVRRAQKGLPPEGDSWWEYTERTTGSFRSHELYHEFKEHLEKLAAYLLERNIADPVTDILPAHRQPRGF